MAKILLVEDDTGLASVVEQWLKDEHHTIEIAYDGASGWEKLERCEFDLVILDWNLPFISGVELCQRYRARQGSVPVLMLTGRNSISEKEEGFDSGADDYLTKPFDMKELSARIRALLRRPHAVLSQQLQVGDIVLDTTKYRVTKSGKEVHLVPKDFAVLEYLMRHPDQVFSSDTLLERIWSSESEATGEALRTSIKRLRQKLDDENVELEQSFIENIPRIGYRLRKP
ncbi:MAG: response regulator transcription factor [Cyanobacteria bacterium SZAS TMP-1]|nr:response regulator transcription factor [Cyanobacteria bacterium SZAS TMP-1]